MSCVMFANMSGFDVLYLLMAFIDFVKLTMDAERPNNGQDVETQMSASIL